MRFRLPRKKHQEAQKLGFRSNFVLAKLGYDLRELYEGVLKEPFPSEIERSLESLRGPGRDVIRLQDHKPGESGVHLS